MIVGWWATVVGFVGAAVVVVLSLFDVCYLMCVGCWFWVLGWWVLVVVVVAVAVAAFGVGRSLLCVVSLLISSEVACSSVKFS